MREMVQGIAAICAQPKMQKLKQDSQQVHALSLSVQNLQQVFRSHADKAVHVSLFYLGYIVWST